MKIITKPIISPVNSIRELRNFTDKINIKKLFYNVSDTFVSTIKPNANMKPVKFSVYNYTNAARYSCDFQADLTKAQTFVLQKVKEPNFPVNVTPQMTVYYNPKRIGQVFEKVFNPQTLKTEKKPLEVNILQAFDGVWETTFYFMKKDLSECVGYVTIGDWQKLAAANGGKAKKGITISFLQNHDNNKYAGIGKLADRLEIEYCLKNNIKPLIRSESDPGAHIAHFLRGKRFYPPNKGHARNFFLRKYKSDNLNEIIPRLLAQSNGKKIDIHDWYIVDMYLPQRVVEKHIKEIKRKPIL